MLENLGNPLEFISLLMVGFPFQTPSDLLDKCLNTRKALSGAPNQLWLLLLEPSNFVKRIPQSSVQKFERFEAEDPKL